MTRARIAFVSVLALSAACAARTPAPETHDIDIAAFANGALIDSVSDEYGGGWQARWLLDERAGSGWASDGKKPASSTIVIALPERSRIDAVEFDTAAVDRSERAAKDIDVALSDTSATKGFTLLIGVSLEPDRDHQRFEAATAGIGRWIRLTIRSNHGDSRYIELMAFRALGLQLTHSPLPSHMAGIYRSSYGAFHLHQHGTRVWGCYEDAGGRFKGTLAPHAMRLDWRQGGDASGTAMMVLGPDGRNFEGWWTVADGVGWNDGWDLVKVGDRPGSCPRWNRQEGNDGAIAIDLRTKGRATLQGVVFDVDGDRLRPESKHALNELVVALKTHPEWHVAIEGHTGPDASVEHDPELGKRRAEAVKAALVAMGIDGDGVIAVGIGRANPVASNASDDGRSQNRRIDVVRK